MQTLPLLYRMIQGSVGKRFVVRHYSGGRIVLSCYPRMQHIQPSEKQRARRRLFRKAVRYAQSVYARPVRKATMYRRLRRPKRLFQALMKEWLKQGEGQLQQQVQVQRYYTTWASSLPFFLGEVKLGYDFVVTQTSRLFLHSPPLNGSLRYFECCSEASSSNDFNASSLGSI